MRRSTFARDLILLALHLVVYIVVVGGILSHTGFTGTSFEAGNADFDAVFWPFYAWGTLIAAQAGTVFLQRRRLLGATLGAMASVLVGAWILGHIDEYRIVSIVFRSIAVALVALAIAVSLLRRPPAMLTGGALTPSARPSAGAPTIAARRPSGLVSFPNLVLGMFAVVFVLSAIVAGTFRALEVRGSGEPGQRGGNLAPFTRISATGVGTLIVQSGPQAALTVMGDDNLLDYVESTTVEGELRLSFEPDARGPVRLERPLVYRVTLPSLESLTIDGEIEASIEPGFERASLRVVVGEDAHLSASGLALESLSVAARDDGRVDLAGQANSTSVEASDAAFINAMDLVVGDANVAISDVSLVELGDAATLRYRQSGSANLQCADVTEVLPGSVFVVPQCAASPMRMPTTEPFDLRRPEPVPQREPRS